ncbi:DUF3352 domain-containing protein [Ancylomarina euxinus]|uniref:DUF3352 domain-containing protein n=1 Tax=Ancylomarina euxinus TaxID=2283627 RepID=A0A425Y847_9BACT|nr:DUF3352 domain-containing protein [Ancylomarina euxinus]MCZ4693469.1 PQQ-binding-like beta-propeller repeat protein [Ancylomarina euxinus]MUP13696.1 PQQ-binding-like beta-propeller repeat protein [Ancylomarina euxinus]RRG24663.1 DUF3352 domain-containing protein [Ancylomarina euxinus]
MLKKSLIPLLAIFFVGILAMAYFYMQKQKEYTTSDHFLAIPASSEIMIHFDNLEDLISKLEKNQGVWKELCEFNTLNGIDKNLKNFSSLINASSSESELDLDRSLTIASQIMGKNQVEYLYVLPVRSYLEEKRIQSFIQDKLNSQKEPISRKYNGTNLYTLSLKDSSKQFLHFCFSKGLMLVSSSMIYLENSVRQLDVSGSISESNGFNQVFKTKGKNVDANIYFNLKHCQKQFASLFTKEIKSHIRHYSHLGNWVELDLSFRDHLVLLNGFTYSNQEENNYLNVFMKQDGVKMEMESVLPGNSGLVAIMGLNDPIQHKNAYRKFLEGNDGLENYLAGLRILKDKTGVDFETLFYSIIHKEIALVYLDNQTDKQFSIIRTKSASAAKEKLVSMLSSYAERTKRSLSYYSTSIKLDGATEFDVFRMPDDFLFEKIFGRMFKGAPSNYMIIFENYMIFGKTKAQLSEFVHASFLRKTLDKDPVYDESKEYLSNRANFFFYTSMPRSNKVISSFLNEAYQTDILEQRESLNKFQSIGFQMSANEDLIYNNVFVKHNPVLELTPQTVWESRLDTAFVHKPFLVENHYTKEKEILVQDLKNQLYLINPVSGRILWKRPLSSPIVGEVSQVDLLRNNKLQYVFVTQDKLYLIDREGKDVSKYPVLLRSKAASGLSVFDYSNNRNYRFFVPGKDKKVYAYSKDGNLLDGWKFEKAENPIISEVQYFRIKDKDYIVFADEYRVYILNRKGQVRVKPNKQISKSKNNAFYHEVGNSKHTDRLVTTDREGNIHYFYMNGNVETQKITGLDNDHHFVAGDIDADGSSEYIISNQNKLHVYESDGNEVLEKEFSSTIFGPPAVYRFSRNKCEIGICLKHDNELHLINTNGDNHKGFPLKGNTAFSIAFSKGTQKGFYLFACDDRNFLLNYSVKL